MKQFPHTSPRSSLIGLAAAAATVATITIGIVLPATMTVRAPAGSAALASRDANSTPVVVLDRIDVVASRPATVHKASTDASVKARG